MRSRILVALSCLVAVNFFPLGVAGPGAKTDRNSLLQVTPAEAKPDLTPKAYSGWTAPIVVYITEGSTVDANPLWDTDQLLARWSFQNIGNAATSGQFFVTLWLDGQIISDLFYEAPINPTVYGKYGGIPLEKLKKGPHTLRVVIDSTNTQNESNETNNEYVKNITVFSAGNHAPTANAGPDQTVTAGQTVQLSGQGSDQDAGDTLTYTWTQSKGPAVAITNSTSKNASFVAPSVVATTELEFTLTVSDGQAATPDTMKVTVNPLPQNHAPVVSAGNDQSVTEGATVTLNGTANDQDGDPMALTWLQTDTTPGVPTVVLQNPNTLHASFQAPAVTQATALHFRFQANDGKGGIGQDDVVVTVNPAPEAPETLVAPMTLTPPGLGPTDSTSPFANTFVGYAFVNTGTGQDQLSLEGRNAEGTLRHIRLSDPTVQKGQYATVNVSLLDSGSDEVTLLAKGQQEPFQGFFMGGDWQSTKLDGIGGKLIESDHFYFPGVEATATRSTLVFVFNPSSSETADLTIRLRWPTGGLKNSTTYSLPPLGTLSSDLGALFGIPSSPPNMFLDLSSDQPVKSFVFIGDNQAFSAMVGQVPTAATTLYAPHFFVSKTGGSTLRLINTASGQAHVNLKARRDNGDQLGGNVFDIASGTMFIGDLATMLEIDTAALGDAETVSGYLELEVSTVSMITPISNSILGNLSFSGNGGEYASTLPLMAEPFDVTMLLHLAQANSLRIFTGLAILNPGDSACSLDVTAYRGNGTVSAHKTANLPAHQRRVDLLNGTLWFGSGFDQAGGHLEIRATAPVFTFALFGSLDLDYLSAIEAQAGE